ncbi:glycoside hydrolase family 3 N-terminal domain-containing protein [Stenotrophomonas sp. MH1]|uniref:Glycoside hydrolase family 3 N-terminal domain-containing protein n=1 Tax=Stenotrophomonas capsici TaxID=3110230 RepID=A0ABU5V1U9_9GAMM|nr:glycoside hydrolase family 3 N-terminal domain-containing protein [Stenotrophomonas sp. MH1]MEA5667330.1 glycoside hydrolase family 3 N-terminal domain-containing protein [Stenotrophomonas sp. MH1]
MKPNSHRVSSRRRLRPLLLCASLALICAGVPAVGAAPASADAAGQINPANWPAPAWPLATDAALEQRVSALMATMTLEEKVGQIIQGDIDSITPDEVRKYRLGSILAGGGSDPGKQYNAPPKAWLDLSDAFWEASMDTSQGGKAIPIIWGIDAMHGQSNIVGATLFPHNIGLGATHNPELLREIARITAAETRTTGMEWTFAPTVAVPQDDRWGRSYEGYSENPELVAKLAGVFVEGLQGKAGDADFLGDTRVMSTIKHFLGDGGTTDGKDQGNTTVTEAQLRDIHAAGYVPGIAAGAQGVMASFNSFHGEKLHGHKPLLTDVLKQRMHFGGFIVGDWNGHGQVRGCTNTDCAQTFNAGLDMAMAPDSWKGLYESTLAHVKDGTIPMARLDDAVHRILLVKFRMGLFEKPKPSERALGGKFELLGSPEHRAVARQAVRESLVLLKNQGGLLPLSPKTRLLVAGDGADNLGKQTGGWTLTWQGDGTKREDFPNADSIWDGLKGQVEAAGGKAELAVDGKYTQKPDVAVVVFGEEPYAEFQGDLPNLMFKGGKSGDLELIQRLKADGIPVVAVFLSGRPLWLNREINAADAFVAAWLPGSEGAGIADVLLRDRKNKQQHDFSGKLSFSWPRRADQYQNNVGQAGYDPLFAYGFGLSYKDRGNLAPLSEDPGIDPNAAANNTWFERGVATTGLTVRLVGSDGRAMDIVHPAATTADGSLVMTAINTDVQEGARQYVWKNDGATIEVRANAPVDLSRQSGSDVFVVMTLKLDATPRNGKASVLATCGEGCQGEVAIGDALGKLPRGQWTRLAVPMKCLTATGIDTAKLDMPFALRAGAGTQLAMSQVMLGTEFDHKAECAIQ